MRRASRRRLQGQPDRLGDLVIADLARPARPRLVVKPVETLFGETPPPLADRVLHRPNAMGDRLVVQPRGRQQDDVRALRQALGRAPAPRPPLEIAALHLAPPNPHRSPAHLPEIGRASCRARWSQYL